MSKVCTAEDVLKFWFEETRPDRWFAKDPAFDQLIARRFAATHAAASRCELFSWRRDAAGSLAEILLLDQFSRNIYRDRPEAFQSDNIALVLAQFAVGRGFDGILSVGQRAFMYMPFMHSESAVIHAEALLLFSQPGLENNLKYEILHKDIIDRFGRYPHRNKVLGRTSTPEELEFLMLPGSAF